MVWSFRKFSYPVFQLAVSAFVQKCFLEQISPFIHFLYNSFHFILQTKINNYHTFANIFHEVLLLYQRILWFIKHYYRLFRKLVQVFNHTPDTDLGHVCFFFHFYILTLTLTLTLITTARTYIWIMYTCIVLVLKKKTMQVHTINVHAIAHMNVAYDDALYM